MFLEPHEAGERFLSCSATYQQATITIVGVPMDDTTTFKPGARFAPRKIRDVSVGLEDFSLPLSMPFPSGQVCDLGDVALPIGNPKRALSEIEKAMEKLLSDGKTPIVLGGEHLITYALFRAVRKHFHSAVLVHVDAHLDLRDNYLGEKLSHATYLRRVVEEFGADYVAAFGARSGIREELEVVKTLRRFVPGSVEGLANFLFRIQEPVYLTVDVDVFDPGFAPGTGAPEPAGISPREFFEELYRIPAEQVVAVDIVETNPLLDTNDITSLLVARIVRDVAILLAKGRGRYAEGGHWV